MASQKCPCKQAFLLHGIIETRHNIRRNLHVILLRPREWRQRVILRRKLEFRSRCSLCCPHHARLRCFRLCRAALELFLCRKRQQSYRFAARTILALGGSANTVPLSYKILSFPKHRSTRAGVLLCFMQIRTDGPPHRGTAVRRIRLCSRPRRSS